MEKKKRNSRAGFTLAETLMAVLIMLLVSGIVAAGIPAAKNAYEKVVLASNAEVMLTTAESALRDELGTAWNVEPVSNSDSITYFSADTGMRSKLEMDGKDLSITEYQGADQNDKLNKLLNADSSNTFQTYRKLVYQSNDDRVKLHVQAKFTVDQAKKLVTVSGLCVKNDDDVALAEWKEKDASGNEKTSFDIHVFSVASPGTSIQIENNQQNNGGE